MQLGVRGAFTSDGYVSGDVAIGRDGSVELGIGVGAGERIAVPGFVDLQVNGFAGVDFLDADEEGFVHACLELARHGVTSFLPTFPTTDWETYVGALHVVHQMMVRAPEGARIHGAHLEGPILALEKRGAHDPALLRPASWEGLSRLVRTGVVAMVTIAPEVPGALDLIETLHGEGIVVSVGHTMADGETAHRAFDLGAAAITHLWNAQLPVTSRQPNAAGVALSRSDVFVCIVCDLVHVSSDTLRLSVAAAGDRFVVVTDAVMAAGMPDGRYVGRADITLRDGTVRLDDGTLAGSACPMDSALRNLVDIGIPLERAVGAMTWLPESAIPGMSGHDLAPGSNADVVVMDDNLTIHEVLVGGRPIT